MTDHWAQNLHSKQVSRIIDSIDSMRPLPMSVRQVLVVLEEPSATASMVARMLGLDQALAANVLVAANSVFLGFGPSCTTLKDAVMRLGFSRIRSMVVGVAAAGTMNVSLMGYNLAAGDLYNHAVATATAAQWFARAFDYPQPEEAYIAGLLHDMGKITLDKFARRDYLVMEDLLQIRNIPVYDVEEKHFGIDHAETGALMARKWSFPPLLGDAIHFHHKPAKSEISPPLAAIINLANYYSPVDEVTLAKLGKRTLAAETIEILKATPEKLENLSTQMLAYYKTNFGSRS